MISIIIPTITGREHHLARCLHAYSETLDKCPHEIIVIRDRPTCGIAWNEGIDRAKGDYIHLSADDLEPHEDWWLAAFVTCSHGHLPEARILNSDGSLHSCGFDATERDDGEIAAFGRIPFFPRDLLPVVFPIIETHYFTDVWVSAKARAAGVETVISRGYLFTHHWAQEGRLSRMQEDQRAYEAALR